MSIFVSPLFEEWRLFFPVVDVGSFGAFKKELLCCPTYGKPPFSGAFAWH
jgi:hypothetical protein